MGLGICLGRGGCLGWRRARVSKFLYYESKFEKKKKKKNLGGVGGGWK